MTCRFAVLLDSPVPPLADVTGLVVLLYEPGVVLVTFTDTVQLVLAAIDAMLIEKLVLPAVTPFGVTPPHVPPGVEFATVNPFGKASLKLTLLRAVVVFGFASVNVIADVPPVAMLVGLNPLEIVAGAKMVTDAVLLGCPGPL